MKIRDLVRRTRLELSETQDKFARRLKTTANTISRWESGTYEVPNKVVEKIMERKQYQVICPQCGGTGIVWKLDMYAPGDTKLSVKKKL